MSSPSRWWSVDSFVTRRIQIKFLSTLPFCPVSDGYKWKSEISHFPSLKHPQPWFYLNSSSSFCRSETKIKQEIPPALTQEAYRLLTPWAIPHLWMGGYPIPGYGAYSCPDLAGVPPPPIQTCQSIPGRRPGTSHWGTPTERTYDPWKYYGMEMGYPLGVNRLKTYAVGNKLADFKCLHSVCL